MKRATETLRRRLTREALILLLLFQGITFTAGAVLIVRPLLQAATGDLAIVMRQAAERWVERATDTTATDGISTPFEDTTAALWLQHQAPIGLRDSYLPFAWVLGDALAAAAGLPGTVLVQVGADQRYWAPLHLPQQTVWVGFDAERIGTRPPLLLALLALALTGLALSFSILVASRMTRPLRQLVTASERLGCGDTEVRVPEQGPAEVAVLAHAFNTLAARLRELLDNRTTLFVGLSHDLRTPLARLRLSLEMIEGGANAELVTGMARDLDTLKRLLDDVLALERGLHLERGQQACIGTILAEVVDAVRRAGHDVEWTAMPCDLAVSELALRRVLENLIENALRYGGPAPLTVMLQCAATGATLEIADRGPGIPADQREAVLRPFYRLESSRSHDTGGSGLGLAIVRQICSSQGWTLTLLDNPGGGLRVRLAIPLQRTANPV